MKTTYAILLVGAIAAGTPAASAVTQRVYHIGNSVTDTINYDGLDALATGRGHNHIYGRHMIPGAPLHWIYSHPNDGFRDNQQAPGSTAGYATTLGGFEWEALTLQPFDRQLGTPTDPVSSENDLAVIREYVTLLRQNPANADTSIYIYSRWPRRGSETQPAPDFNYQQLWNRTYTGGWDGTNESRDYFQKVTVGTRQVVQNLGGTNPVWMVPVGDVLYELDRRAEQGAFGSKLDDVVDVYTDGIHFGNLGSYLVGLTFYATLYKDDPNGLPVPANWANVSSTNAGYFDFPNTPSPSPVRPDLTAADIALLQDIVWDVVNGHPYSGVNVVVPEPASLMVLGALGVLALKRRK